MITKRNAKWIMYSKDMTLKELATYFNMAYWTAVKHNPRLNFATIYDAMHNIRPLRKRKEWLYSLNPDEAITHNLLENQLDMIWEGYMERLEYEEQLKEEQYESGHIDWKLNKGFRE